MLKAFFLKKTKGKEKKETKKKSFTKQYIFLIYLLRSLLFLFVRPRIIHLNDIYFEEEKNMYTGI